jgi:ATP-dependent exoDNAse (exonuclease V) beta subunit
LHLVTALPAQDEEGRYRNPYGGSLLALLWPQMEHEFTAAASEAAARHERPSAPWFARLPASWRRSEPPPDVLAPVAASAVDERVESTEGIVFDWAGEVVRLVGIVVHRLLERIAVEGVDAWDGSRVAGEGELIETMLAESGVPAARRPGAAARVVQALTTTLADPDGRWVLSAGGEGAQSEFAVAGLEGGRTSRRRIDRCFVDGDGVRWIVDFKVSPHEGRDLETFIAEQTRRYRPQLEAYARLLAALYPNETARRVALYFTLQGRMAAWTPAAG